MKRVTIIIMFILAVAAKARRRRVCSMQVDIPHEGVPIPFASPVSTTIPLRIHVLCAARDGFLHKKLPLVILMPGALARPFDYSTIANTLARFGFVVAIPSYSSRMLFEALSPLFNAFQAFVQQTIDMGFACNPNGQFVTVKLISSVLNFFLSNDPPYVRLRQSTNLKKTIIFGHTMGGAVSELFFNGICSNFSIPVVPPPMPLISDPTVLQRTVCEQFTPFRSKKVNVHGLVTYEGLSSNSTIVPVESDSFYVIIHSKFFSERVNDFFGDRKFDGKVATVMISNANHYAPTNFVTENDNQKPVCARFRPEPENMFTTTRRIQMKVIKTIARAVKASFDVYVGRKGRRKLRRLVRKRGLLVERVHFL